MYTTPISYRQELKKRFIDFDWKLFVKQVTTQFPSKKKPNKVWAIFLQWRHAHATLLQNIALFINTWTFSQSRHCHVTYALSATFHQVAKFRKKDLELEKKKKKSGLPWKKSLAEKMGWNCRIEIADLLKLKNSLADSYDNNRKKQTKKTVRKGLYSKRYYSSGVFLLMSRLIII